MDKDQRICWYGEDGILKICCPAPEALEEKGRTLEQIAQRAAPTGVQYSYIHKSNIPNDKEFRRHWKLNQDKTRVIPEFTPEGIQFEREERIKKLKKRVEEKEDELGKEFIKASLKNGSSQTESQNRIKAKFNQLQAKKDELEIGAILDNLTDVREIRNFTPEELR